MKRILLLLSLISATVSLHGQGQPRVHAIRGKQQPFSVVEATIPEMQAAMKQGRVTSRELVVQYLIRIALYNRRLNGVITVNPRALQDAEARDRERAQGKVRGPLHGIPIALKDNIQTTDLPTTGGALAFDAFVPPYEATLTKNLRDAGAVIIAKTTMTELANWVAGGPTPMPGGYNALVGFSMNPYDPRRDPRDATFDGRPALGTGGSSFGQSQLDISDEMDIDADRARYDADRAKDLDLAGAQGIDAALKENNLDALLFPGGTGAAIAAKPGYPTVIVPFGMVANAPDVPFPEGFNAKPAPFAVSFTGTACSEPRLLELAYAFEHATKRRVPPSSAP